MLSLGVCPELQTRLVASANHIPVIFITAFPDDIKREQAWSSGSVCFLIKPASKKQLLSCIHRALDIGRSRRTDHRNICFNLTIRLRMVAPRNWAGKYPAGD
jgi:FixJ family two-component response regulator